MLQQIRSLEANTVHLLGHSLGGIVVMHMLQQNSELPPTQQLPEGRVVLMAAPVQGSQLARWMFAKRWLKPLLGNSVHQGVLGQAPLDLLGRTAGVIHGSSRTGLAAMLFRLPGVNDGVVTESETVLNDASDTICIPHSHALMLFSTESVDKVAAFLQHGRFVRT